MSSTFFKKKSCINQRPDIDNLLVKVRILNTIFRRLLVLSLFPLFVVENSYNVEGL